MSVSPTEARRVAGQVREVRSPDAGKQFHLPPEVGVSMADISASGVLADVP